MNDIFVDTSAWITLVNRDELRHQEAMEIYKKHLIRLRIVVSNFVVGETYTWLRKKASWEEALSFLESLKEKEKLGQLFILYSTPEIEESAYQLLASYADQPFSYADAVSFVLMRKEKIKKAFSYDRHFHTAGFTLINRL